MLRGMPAEASSLDVMLNAIEVMTSWNDADSNLMPVTVSAQLADAGHVGLIALTVGLAHLCDVLLSRVSADSDCSKLELLQILAGVFIAEDAVNSASGV
jgi:hypothetical protein